MKKTNKQYSNSVELIINVDEEIKNAMLSLSDFLSIKEFKAFFKYILSKDSSLFKIELENESDYVKLMAKFWDMKECFSNIDSYCFNLDKDRDDEEC